MIIPDASVLPPSGMTTFHLVAATAGGHWAVDALV
jgi:hypothetical protein